MTTYSNSFSAFKKPSVSVIMAVYNTERYLEPAVASLQRQTFGDFELVIVDDGSTDDSPNIIKKLAAQDRRIKWFRQDNAGIGAATSHAISESCGDYIAIMDSDDIALPDRLALQKAFLDRHPDIDAVGSQWRMLNAAGDDVGIDTHPLDSDTIASMMFAYFALHHPTTMMLRSAIDKVGGYLTDRSCVVPDYDVFMRIRLAGCRFANLPQVLFVWRLNPNSTTRTKSYAQKQSVLEVGDQGFARLLDENPEQARMIAQAIVAHFPTGTWEDQHIQQLFPDRAESLLFKTWKALPSASPEERLQRALVLWLRDPAEVAAELHELLLLQAMPWLASLLAAYHGLGKPLVAPCLELPEAHDDDSPAVTLLLPFESDVQDFVERLTQAVALQQSAEFAIELGIFCASATDFDRSLLAQCAESANYFVIDGACGWQAALVRARGRYCAYLEASFRFEPARFLLFLSATLAQHTDCVYLLDTRFFTEAVDAEGLPLVDNSPTPRWTRSTLFGKDRIHLSGFIHRRHLLNGFNGNLPECGVMAGRVLARFLATHSAFSIESGALRYFIPALRLRDRSLKRFSNPHSGLVLRLRHDRFAGAVFLAVTAET